MEFFGSNRSFFYTDCFVFPQGLLLFNGAILQVLGQCLAMTKASHFSCWIYLTFFYCEERKKKKSFGILKLIHHFNTESESIQYEKKLGSLPWLCVTRTSYCVSAAPFSFSRVYFRLESMESLKVVASAWCFALSRFCSMSPLLCHFMLQCIECVFTA